MFNVESPENHYGKGKTKTNTASMLKLPDRIVIENVPYYTKKSKPIFYKRNKSRKSRKQRGY